MSITNNNYDDINTVAKYDNIIDKIMKKVHITINNDEITHEHFNEFYYDSRIDGIILEGDIKAFKDLMKKSLVIYTYKRSDNRKTQTILSMFHVLTNKFKGKISYLKELQINANDAVFRYQYDMFNELSAFRSCDKTIFSYFIEEQPTLEFMYNVIKTINIDAEETLSYNIDHRYFETEKKDMRVFKYEPINAKAVNRKSKGDIMIYVEIAKKYYLAWDIYEDNKIFLYWAHLDNNNE